jgi:LysM repeat protein
MEKEYQQVRTIALRDARVQAAYRDADRRLDAKILQIDPALESLVRAKQAAREGTPLPTAAKPAPKPATVAKTPPPKPAVKPVAARPATHTVTSGETLGGIAAAHRVSVAALKSANRISDERKLRVGQVLTIPSGKVTPPAKKNEGVWSRLMH